MAVCCTMVHAVYSDLQLLGNCKVGVRAGRMMQAERAGNTKQAALVGKPAVVGWRSSVQDTDCV